MIHASVYSCCTDESDVIENTRPLRDKDDITFVNKHFNRRQNLVKQFVRKELGNQCRVWWRFLWNPADFLGPTEGS